MGSRLVKFVGAYLGGSGASTGGRAGATAGRPCALCLPPVIGREVRGRQDLRLC